MILVDTCVLLDLMTEDPRWVDWSEEAINTAGRTDRLAVNPVIFGEAAVGVARRQIEDSLADYAFLPLSREVAWRAAQAHSDHLARGGKRRRILGDFWIGAHAEVERLALLTRNPKDYARFQIPEIISP